MINKSTKDSLFDTKIVQIFSKASAFFTFAVERIVDSATSSRVVLEEVREVANELQNKYSAWANLRIPEEYLRGANELLDERTLDNLLEPLESLTIAQATTELDTLVASRLSRGNIDILADVVREAEGYNARRVSDLVQRLEKLATDGANNTQAIAELVAKKGVGNTQRIEEVTQELRTQGVSYFTDARGVKWKPERYANMIVRTETAKSYNIGSIQQAIRFGYKSMIRVELNGHCPICAPHDGEIRDLDMQGFPTPLIYHPNCRGKWVGHKKR